MVDKLASFADYALSEGVLRAIEKMGFTEPTAVQAQTIPLISEGHDLIALAETGSGKTASCVIPIVDKLDPKQNCIQALVLVPTRELALQYATEAQKIAKETGVSVLAILGGADASLQEEKLRSGVQFCVATPGRLIDFIYSRSIDLSSTRYLVLDEADEMLSMGFVDDLEFIFECLVQEHQSLLFSATMPAGIRGLAKKWMKEPKELRLNSKKVTPKNLAHFFSFCQFSQKDSELKKLFEKQKPSQAIVFCESRRSCEQLFASLKKDFCSVDFLHGGMMQGARSSITRKFQTGKLRFLIATDVAARGLDFGGITHVYIYEVSSDPEVYIHRSGRCARSGKEGVCTTLFSKKELSSVQKLLKKSKVNAQWIGKKPLELSQDKVIAPPKFKRKITKARET